jgi:predicted Holliday junction resolvase-like endonuclease
MKIIIGAIVFGLIIIAIIIMVVINFTYRGIKKLREQAEDDYYRHQKEMEQKEKHPFGKDYFKSAAPKKQQTTTRPNKPKEDLKKETARSTKTTDRKSNVTIIDDREASNKRKIFDDKDGEYVEFEEI